MKYHYTLCVTSLLTSITIGNLWNTALADETAEVLGGMVIIGDATNMRALPGSASVDR